MEILALYLAAMGASFFLSMVLAHHGSWWSRMGLALGGTVIATALLWFDCSPGALIAPALAGVFGVLPRAGQSTNALHSALGRSMFWVYLGAFATVALTLWVYLPVLVFLTSPGELAIHTSFLLSNNLRAAMTSIDLALLVYAMCISAKLRAALTALAVAGMAVALTYSFVLPFGYPRLSGLQFEQVALATFVVVLRVAVDIAVVVVLPLAVVWLLMRVGGRRFLLGLAFVNLSLGLATYRAIQMDVGGQVAEHASIAAPAPLRFSQHGHNALLIFVDRFMGGYVEKILAAEPTLNTELDGFIWVPKTASAGFNSISGLHPLLGGYDYTPREMNDRHLPLRELSNEAFSILPWNFTQKGWAATLLKPHGLNFTVQGDCSVLSIPGLNCGQIPLHFSQRAAERQGISLETLSRSNYVDLLVLLSAMRTAPYVIKATLMDRGPWEPFLRHTAGSTLREWAELEALPELSSAEADKNQLNIVFNFLPHEPYYLSEDCKPLAERIEPSEELLTAGNWSDAFAYHHEIGARCTLLLLRDYLRWLKQQHVYDNTTIVIASDHGIVNSVRDHSSRAIAGGTQDNHFVASRSLLLYKPSGARGPLQISEQFLPNAEAPRILCQEIGGCINPFLQGKSVEAHGRDDPFYVDVVPWQFSAQKHDAFVIEMELKLTGKDPYQRANWQTVR